MTKRGTTETAAYVYGWILLTGMGMAHGADTLQYLNPDAERGASGAVVVGDVPLLHTTQFLPIDEQGKLVSAEDVAAQVKSVLDQLEQALAAAGSGAGQLVKLNLYVADTTVTSAVESALAERFSTDRKPAVSYVQTRLPLAGAKVAVDAVAVAPEGSARQVSLFRAEGSPAVDARYSVMPSGSRIYVAGQAEKGMTLAEATRKTLDSLRDTVRFLGRREADIGQLKAFLSPMTDAQEAKKAFADYFGESRVPPLVLVEWNAPLIEIELVAWGGMHNAGPVVEYLTPPGMTTPTIYSRVARIHSARSIYVSGLFARQDGDATAEVSDLFAQLDHSLKAVGSDLRHLVKATYYCANDATSQKLNELRPQYYDPQRPPAASKALVAGVGRPARGITIDMIAVPAWDDATAEYGPAEFGRGLTAEQARQGWCSLFDGKSTFGWTGGQVDDQGLGAGKSNCRFNGVQLAIDVARSGAIHHGDKTYALEPGKQMVELSAVSAPLRLDDAIRVRSIAFLPLGLKQIFDGQTLTNWQRIDRDSIPDSARPQWTVAEGVLRAEGGPGALEYVERQYGDFILQLDIRTLRRHVNGGVFFRALSGDFMNGYEAQIYHRAQNGDPSQPAPYSTGAIDDRQSARRLVSRDGQTATMTIMAQGPHLATWVNGVAMADWTDTRSLAENPREGLRLAPGALQLQAHDAGTSIEFSNLRIGELPAAGD